MPQVGETKVFSIDPAPVSDDIYAYVWTWWDGSTEATEIPQVTKRINLGGEPGTEELHYQCVAVLEDGRSVTLNGTLASVNHPPVLQPPVQITVNDDYFPFTTELSVTAFDPNGEAFTFAWYEGDTLLGTGDLEYVGPISSTWTGHGRTITGDYSGTNSTLELTVSANRQITLYVIDASSGTSTLDFELRGKAPPLPDVSGASAAQTVFGENAVRPVVLVEPGAELVFSVYAKDPSGGALTFLWDFPEISGWTQAPSTSAGTDTPTEDGGVQNTVVRDVSGETFATGNQKTVTATVTVTGPAGSVSLLFEATLLRNQPPQNLRPSVKAANQPYDLTELVAVPAGTELEFFCEADDANGDILDFFWEVVTPSGLLRLWGARVQVDTSSFSAGQSVLATVTALDRSGNSDPYTLPAIPISAAVATSVPSTSSSLTVSQTYTTSIQAVDNQVVDVGHPLNSSTVQTRVVDSLGQDVTVATAPTPSNPTGSVQLTFGIFGEPVVPETFTVVISN